MSISHHPEDATLMAFSAGTLSEPFAIVVAAHLEMCGGCRGHIRRLTALGASVMQAAAPVEVSAGALDALMAQLDAPATVDAKRMKPVPAMPANGAGLPAALARVLGGGLDAIKWRHVIPGAEDKRVYFKTKKGTHSLRFLKAQPGMMLPEHAHVGTELTLVLKGALKDGEAVFGPGDVTDMDDEGTHNPVVHGQDACICVIANEAPPLFSQLKFRILQKLIGI